MLGNVTQKAYLCGIIFLGSGRPAMFLGYAAATKRCCKHTRASLLFYIIQTVQ